MQNAILKPRVGSSRTILIAISVGLNFIGFTLIDPIVPFLIGGYIKQEQLALGVGALTSVYAVCEFIAAPILGALSDRWGRRPVLLLSLAGSMIGYLLLASGQSLWVLFLGRIIDGLTAGNITAMYAYIADVNAPEERGRAYGVLGAAGGLGFIVGPVLGGLLGEISIRLPMLVAAGLTLINMGWIYLYLPESVQPLRRKEPIRWPDFVSFKQFSVVRSHRTLRYALGASCLFFFAGAMFQSNITVMLKDHLHFGPMNIGALLCAVGLIDVIAQGIVTPRLLSFLPTAKLAGYGLFINAVGFVLFALLITQHSILLLGLGVVVFTLGDGLFQPSATSLISASVSEHQQGQVQGVNQAQQAGARAIGPLVGASLYSMANAMPYAMGALLVLLGARIVSTRVCDSTG